MGVLEAACASCLEQRGAEQAFEDFAAHAAHRSHQVRSVPGGNRSRIARLSVFSAARLIARSSIRASFEQAAV